MDQPFIGFREQRRVRRLHVAVRPIAAWLPLARATDVWSPKASLLPAPA